MQTIGIYKFCNYSYNKSSQNFIASNISDHFLSFIVSVGPDDDSLGWVILVWYLSGDAFSWWLGSFQRLFQSSVWCRTGKNWVYKVIELWGPLRCLCPFMVSLYSFSNLVTSRSPDFLWKQETREVSGPQGLRGHFFWRLTLHLHTLEDGCFLTFCALAPLLPHPICNPAYMSHSISSTLHSSEELQAQRQGEGTQRRELHLDKNSVSHIV